MPVEGHSEEWTLYREEVMTFLKNELIRIGEGTSS